MKKNIKTTAIKNNPVKQPKATDFIPKPVEEGTEIFRNGFFQYNITEILKYIHQNKRKFAIEEIDLRTYKGGSSIINEEHMESVVLGEPLIF